MKKIFLFLSAIVFYSTLFLTNNIFAEIKVPGSGGKTRKIELTILKLGKKQKDKIKFNWKLYDGGGKLMDDNDYTFSAGKAMTKLNDKKISK